MNLKLIAIFLLANFSQLGFLWYLGVTDQNIYLAIAAINFLIAGIVWALETVKHEYLIRQPEDPTLQIASETLTYLRRGLNQDTARKTAEVIKKMTNVSAVAITDRTQVLTYLGAGCDMHQPGDNILTEATKKVIQTGKSSLVNSTLQLNCPIKNCECPHKTAVIVPLKFKDEVIGVLKLYQTEYGKMPRSTVRQAHGLAQLLSMQIQLSELDRRTQLLTMAKLDALHAQINPHFLFNTLNTIITFSRTDPGKTRKLLIHLSEFFRHSLKSKGHMITLQEELEYINTYVVLENARFGDKLKVIQRIDPEIYNWKIPVLSIQPLVENAIKHGVTPKIDGGTVKVIGTRKDDEMILKVIDDGVGISPDQIDQILEPGYGAGNGVGLSNVSERFKSLYGEDYAIKIFSSKDEGTTIVLRVPYEESVDNYGELRGEAYEV